MRRKNRTFILLTVIALAATLPPLYVFVNNARPADHYSHIPLIPFVSLYLVLKHRKEMFSGGMVAHPVGISLMIAGGGGLLAGWLAGITAIDRATIISLAGFSFLIGSYLVFYGSAGAKHCLFPFAFLIFAVPIPVPIIEGIVSVLVAGSVFMTRLLFDALSVPFVQEGAIFHLPGFSIEVAEECSSIRSSLALFITSILAGHLFLKRFWTKVLLLSFVVPVAVFKNAVRIVTLTLLSGFIDMKIIRGGFLHKSGGFVFFGLGLFVMGVILFIIREMESRD